MRISLNGTWRLKRCGHAESHSDVFAPDFLPEGWIDAPVPGDVRTALKARGFIDGDYFGKALDQERWIDESDWLYYCRFTLPQAAGIPFLELEGVDTLAEVWLNGQKVGECANMFLPWSFPIQDYLEMGDNALLIRIRSTVKTLEGLSREGLYPSEDTDRLLLRKSQMNFGWDFCGHCLTHGLWKGVSVRFQENPELMSPYLWTESIENGNANLILQTEISWAGTKALSDETWIELRLSDGRKTCFHQKWPARQPGKMRCVLPKARLWWPRPYGESFLYQAEVLLYCGENILDRKHFHLGIRTIELLQDPLPKGGRKFALRVNGRELFIRGANWVPTRAVYAEIQPEDEMFFLQKAAEANLSMLRVWGGGIYESESFFDFCDTHGILIMQDFMLACGIFPQNDAFLKQVSEEVNWVVKHYRNRPSVAILSADNELDEAYRWYDLLPQFPTNKINRIAVRRSVEALDPNRPFLVSSPCSPFENEPGGEDPNSSLQGDMHVYLTRFQKASPYYYKKLLEFVPRFMSEYGFSSLPCRDSYEKFNFFHKPLDMQANPWLGELPAFQQMRDDGDISEMIYFTQYTHARGLQYWIEYMRSHKGVCGGTLYWKFNDPIAPNREDMLFPSLMSVIDFYGMPKLAYDYTRRAYEDTILAFREEGGTIQIYGCNETMQAHDGMLTLWWIDHFGKRTLIHQQRTKIRKDSSTLLDVWEAQKDQEKKRGYLKAEFIDFNGHVQLQNRFFPGDIGDYVGFIPPRTELKCNVLEKRENGMTLSIYSSNFAQDVCLTLLNRNAWYSDNAFDMDAGETRVIHVKLPKEAQTKNPLRISALNAASQLVSWSDIKKGE